MFLRIFRSLLPGGAAVLLAACGGEGATVDEAEREAAVEAGKIECALAGAADFKRVCTTETVASDSGRMLVVRHPNGGFRRFDILTDGRGLAPADGFDETGIKILSNGMIEVKSGDDSYRLPADIKGSTAK
jgi:hypothetical protein